MDPINKLPQLAKALTIEPLFDVVPPEKRRLGLFLLLVGLLHVAAFSFIQITYPQPPIRTASRVHVTLTETLSQAPVNRTSLRFWYALEDPSLLIRPRDPVIDTAKIEITPIKHDSIPAAQPVTLPVRDDKISFLPDGLPSLTERAGAMMEPPRQIFAYADSKTSTAKPTTTLSLDPALSARAITPLPTLPKQASSLLTEAGATILRVGVNPDGRVAHVLVEQSCGKAAVDAVALQALRKTHFQPATGVNPGLVWGQVTVYWQFEPEPTPAATPTAAPAPAQ